MDDPDYPAARFAPEAIVVRLPERRRTPEGVEMRIEAKERWERIHPMVDAALDALGQGADFEATVRAAAPLAAPDGIRGEQVHTIVRQFLWRLHRMGAVRIPFEEPPAMFHGRYRRVKEIGRGGVGVAHLCVDERTGDDVVVKHAWGYVRPARKNDEAIEREASVFARLDHPGFARVHETFRERGLFHLVRTYADGPPISVGLPALAQDRPRRLRLLLEVLAAAAHAESRGLLVMDPKPANIATRGGQALIVDVGGLQPHEGGRLTRARPGGAKGFVAPEILDGKGGDVRSAIFSFGCLHLACATGRAPFERTPWRAMERRLAEAGVDAAESALVLRCVADDPAARPAGYHEIERAIEKL